MFSRVTSTGCIFIVGCPRSGTTLLQSLLASHSAISSFPESKFFLRLIAEPRQKSRRYKLGLASADIKPTLKRFLDEVDAPDLTLPKLPFVRSYVAGFDRILSQLAQRQGKHIWLEKTPEHLHSISDIQRYLPQAKIIHIVRNGTDTIASLYDLCQRHPQIWGQYFEGLEGCIDRWINDVAISRRYLAQPNHTVVRYETLVDSTEVEIQQLCQFLGVSFEATMLTRYQHTSQGLVRRRENWKGLNQAAIQTTGGKKFHTLLDPAQQRHVLERIAQTDLDIFGQGGVSEESEADASVSVQ
ncbi:sulfotransferase [Leptolyngbya cf. ectocarpi LEGE 11479]|uniref:Sulfotransferase n=1 Tax=Leptolyngbya cf. ectocarpi LEGE 11479 TaxID=1828722 RepID=A0A928ZU37_LEPEC|nr:sulfotransferase [Leptolyngbya ectocarpi]MBE9067473.1 sulfotransferase [Leptolyngbya cf. ectocarpi LEGE 11479]